MQGKSFSSVLQDLAHDYFNHRLSHEEYRVKRKQLLDYIDAYFNQAPVTPDLTPAAEQEEPTQEYRYSEDDTQPHF